MPYLQLDTPYPCSADDKRRLAKRLGDVYARHMQADINQVTVAVRVLEDGIWRCGEGEPRPAGLLMCDIRRGRSAQQRAELAERLLDVCREILGFGEGDLNLEFTQHAGDEMSSPGERTPSCCSTARAGTTPRMGDRPIVKGDDRWQASFSWWVLLLCSSSPPSAMPSRVAVRLLGPRREPSVGPS
jgi:phenylpyruvate tautomerase PptA (4-oxalocrotonate tautomerase family)